MEEYKYKTGGRRLYNEDIERLQDLALSCTEFFARAGINFVINGCGVSVEENGAQSTWTIGAGYVFLNGKVRVVNAITITGPSIQTPYIVEDDYDGPNIKYADGTTGTAYRVYGTAIELRSSDSPDVEAATDAIVCRFFPGNGMLDTEANIERRFADMREFVATFAVSSNNLWWRFLIASLQMPRIPMYGPGVTPESYTSAVKLRKVDWSDAANPQYNEDTFCEMRPHRLYSQKEGSTDSTTISGGTITTKNIKTDTIECDSVYIVTQETTETGAVITKRMQFDPYEYATQLKKEINEMVGGLQSKVELQEALITNLKNKNDELVTQYTNLYEEYHKQTSEVVDDEKEPVTP